MRVEYAPKLTVNSPIVQLASDGINVVAATENRVLLAHYGGQNMTLSKVSKFPKYIQSVSSSQSLFAVISEDGLLFIQSLDPQETRIVPPIRIHRYADVDTRALRIIDKFILLGSGRFVLVLDLERIFKEVAIQTEDTPPLLELPLKSSWGRMHGLHSEQVTDVLLSEDLSFVVSTGQDGLICIANIAKMDRLNPSVIYEPNEYNEDQADASDDLLVMCISLGSPIRQMILTESGFVVVVTDTHETAVYKFECLARLRDAVSSQTNFAIIKEPNRDALERGWQTLLAARTGAETSGESDDMLGIVDIACLVHSSMHDTVWAVLSHSNGGACLVEIYKSESAACSADEVEPVIGVETEYIRCALSVGDKIIFGTDSGRIYFQKAIAQSKKRKSATFTSSDRKLARVEHD